MPLHNPQVSGICSLLAADQEVGASRSPGVYVENLPGRNSSQAPRCIAMLGMLGAPSPLPAGHRATALPAVVFIPLGLLTEAEQLSTVLGDPRGLSPSLTAPGLAQRVWSLRGTRCSAWRWCCSAAGLGLGSSLPWMYARAEPLLCGVRVEMGPSSIAEPPSLHSRPSQLWAAASWSHVGLGLRGLGAGGPRSEVTSCLSAQPASISR